MAEAAARAASTSDPAFLTFRLHERRYALPAEDVSEVIPVPAAARVPQSPPALLGIANLRGSVLPLVSLRELLGMDRASDGDREGSAIVLQGAAPVALVVDRVETLVRVEEQRVETREAELGAEPGEVLRGAFDTGAGTVAKVLDVKALLASAFERRSRRERHAPGNAAPAQEARSAAAEATQMLVSFEVAGQEFALQIEAVQEILPVPAGLTLVPKAEALVLGVTSVRDRLLPLLSLRGLLGFPSAGSRDAREKVVVMKIGGGQVGLVADRARAVLRAPASMIDELPAVLAARAGGESRIRAILRAESGKRLVSILAPEQLFRDEVMQRIGAASDGNGKAMDAAERRGERGESQFLVFRLGEDEFALPISEVDEVGHVPASVTRVPQTPEFLEGVVHLRGDVLPVIDQRRRFGMPVSDNPGARRLVVVRTERHRAGLIVDSVSEVLRVSTASIEPAPDLTERTGRLVRGVINLESSRRIVLVLDPVELLTPAERELLESFEQSGQARA